MQRMTENVMPRIYKGSKYEDCLPIGSMEIVDNFPYQDLRDYYQKWYRPDLQAIVIVGDIDGVICIPREIAYEVLLRADGIERNEVDIFSWVHQGDTISEIIDKGGCF